MLQQDYPCSAAQLQRALTRAAELGYDADVLLDAASAAATAASEAGGDRWERVGVTAR